MTDRNAHLPPGVDSVDLAAGGTLTGSWSAAWARDPGATVITTLDGVEMSAEELAGRSAAAAARYAAAGLAPGDRLLMSAAPDVDLVVAYVGALRYGLSVVPANPAYTAAELAALVAAARPRLAVLDDPARLGGAARLDDPARLGDLSGVGGPRAVPPDLAGLPTGGEPPLDRAAPGDTALVVYTSGTTGRPKGTVLSHANLLASAHAVRVAWRWEPDDRLALCLPLFHVHGLGVGLHATLTAGASMVLMPRFDPAAVAAAIAGHGASMFFGVPTMYHRLASSPHLAALRPLRLAVSGSAPLPAQLHAAIAEGCGQRVLERYGMTETLMLVSNPYDGQRRPGTVGFALPGVSLRLAPRAAPAGTRAGAGSGAEAAATPADGGAAEIEVRGPNVTAGYLDRPDATADAFTADGWFRTGDLGEFDDDGYLRICGRAKELIITGGYNVHPREVEEALRACPGVADAAVVGAASAEWGESVVAFVVPVDAITEGELSRWCAQRLAPYKRPRAWRFVDAIPRNALGKTLRHELTP